MYQLHQYWKKSEDEEDAVSLAPKNVTVKRAKGEADEGSSEEETESRNE